MGRLRNTLATAAIGAALTASNAAADEAPAPAAAAPTAVEPSAPAPASTTKVPAPVSPGLQQGTTIAAPPPAPSEPKTPAKSAGGTSAKEAREQRAEPSTHTAPSTGATTPLSPPAQTFAIPSIPSSSCAAAGVPTVLIPIYQRAATAYGLGPQGPAVLAGINEVETAFGTNLNLSSAGADGLDAVHAVDLGNLRRRRQRRRRQGPLQPRRRDLRRGELPERGRHARRHLRRDLLLQPRRLVRRRGPRQRRIATRRSSAAAAERPDRRRRNCKCSSCRPASRWRDARSRPTTSAPSRTRRRATNSGSRGVWALAAVARLESDFGRGMTKQELRTAPGRSGSNRPSGSSYAVDGDEDGRIRHADPADSAATLARLIWSRGSLRAGIFAHNQAEWYVQAVLAECGKARGHLQHPLRRLVGRAARSRRQLRQSLLR